MQGKIKQSVESKRQKRAQNVRGQGVVSSTQCQHSRQQLETAYVYIYAQQEGTTNVQTFKKTPVVHPRVLHHVHQTCPSDYNIHEVNVTYHHDVVAVLQRENKQ